MAPLEFSDDEQPQRNFELDHVGRPRFVYGDNDSFREPDHVGTYYAFCDSDCTIASNWSEVRINKDNGGVGPYRSEDFHYPVSAFSTTGQPRVLADGARCRMSRAFFYVACDSACAELTAGTAPPFERGSGNNVAYDIEIDAQGRPRIASLIGARLNEEGEWLYYGWCNQACTDASNWRRFDFNWRQRKGKSLTWIGCRGQATHRLCAV